MPVRSEPFTDGEYYHIYNRGVAKRNIFLNQRNYLRFERTLSFYQYANSKPKFSYYIHRQSDEQQKMLASIQRHEDVLVQLIAYCLMPNHFHLLLQQVKSEGISQFIGQVANSYTRYFNTVNNRVGPLFQGPFRSKRVENDTQLIHLSRYIHLNPTTAGLVKASELAEYQWSSLSQYLTNNPTGTLITKMRPVLEHFSNASDYRQFVFDQLAYQQTLGLLKKHLYDER